MTRAPAPSSHWSNFAHLPKLKTPFIRELALTHYYPVCGGALVEPPMLDVSKRESIPLKVPLRTRILSWLRSPSIPFGVDERMVHIEAQVRRLSEFVTAWNPEEQVRGISIQSKSALIRDSVGFEWSFAYDFDVADLDPSCAKSQGSLLQSFKDANRRQAESDAKFTEDYLLRRAIILPQVRVAPLQARPSAIPRVSSIQAGAHLGSGLSISIAVRAGSVLFAYPEHCASAFPLPFAAVESIATKNVEDLVAKAAVKIPTQNQPLWEYHSTEGEASALFLGLARDPDFVRQKDLALALPHRDQMVLLNVRANHRREFPGLISEVFQKSLRPISPTIFLVKDGSLKEWQSDSTR